MARPRVFISSTFYDLRQIREDIDRFVKDLGYDPVRHEMGGIAYGSKEAPEKYAFKEVGLCDILVCIIGNRYGTEARGGSGNSITQAELKHALEKGIQVFIFIEQAVHSEYQTYQINKETKEFRYRHVDDRRIYEFLDLIYALPANNPIASFNTSRDITDYLREQWAGLFQRFLASQSRIEEINVLSQMKSVSTTLSQLVELVSSQVKDKDDKLQNILSVNHPVFRRFAELTKTPYRVYFQTLAEVNVWLSVRSFKAVGKDHLDPDSVLEWVDSEKKKYIKLTHSLFKEGVLIQMSEAEFKQNWLTIHDCNDEQRDNGEDDEPPF